LDLRARRLASVLRASGVGPDVAVGVFLERGPELATAALAVLYAGGAYLPLDPGYPSERLAYMLADAAVPVLVTEERLLGLVAGSSARLVVLDAEPRTWLDAEPLPRPRRSTSISWATSSTPRARPGGRRGS